MMIHKTARLVARNTNVLTMGDFSLDPRNEEDKWYWNDSSEDEQWDDDSDSEGSVRSVVSESDDDESIPSIATRVSSIRASSTAEQSVSEVDKKSATSSVYTCDSAYGSPIHQYETDTNMSATYCSSRPYPYIHSNTDQVSKASSSDVGRQCQVCDTSFVDGDEYQVHVRTHERLKKMVCPFCCIMSSNGDDFFNHLKTHESLNLQCKICLKQFRFSNSLAEHQKFHARWRKCPFHSCKKLFRTLDSYRQHMKTHAVYGEEYVDDKPAPKKRPLSSCSSYSDDGISEKMVYSQEDSEEEDATREVVSQDKDERGHHDSEPTLAIRQPLNKKFCIDKSMKLKIKKTLELPTEGQNGNEGYRHKRRIKPLIY